jgi:hypothetical protein
MPTVIPRLLSGGGDISEDKFTPQEAERFDDGLQRLAYIHSLARPLHELILDFKDEFRAAAQVAKSRFRNSFGGADPGGNDFGMSFIRPKVFGLTNWQLNFTSTGWQNVWGSSGSQITMPDTSGARALIAFSAILSMSTSPKVMEGRFVVEGKDYPIWNFQPWWGVGDVYIAILPGVVVVGPGNSFYFRGNVEVTGNDTLIPFGIEYAISTYMRTE